MAVVAVAAVPIVAASARQGLRGWQPTQDTANVARLAYDVFTRRTPLLGMPATFGTGAGPPAHHLGPTEFWALAVPLRVFALSPFGLLFGVTALNVAALIGLTVFVQRRVGFAGVVWALGVLTLIFFSLGQSVLSSLLNPDIAIVPLAFFLVSAWSLADGDALALPFAALTASFVAQAHLVYVPIVVVIGLAGVIGLAATRFRRAAARFVAEPSDGRTIVCAVGVLIICWSTAIYQVVIHLPGFGNLSAVYHGLQHPQGPSIGVWKALHIVTRSLAVVPLLTRPVRVAEPVTDGLYRSPSLLVDATALLVLVAALVALRRAWGRDRTVVALLGTVLLAIGVTVFSVASVVPAYGTVMPRYWVHALWLTGPLVLFALGVALARSGAGIAPARARAVASGALVALLVAGSAAATLHTTPRPDPDTAVIVRALSRQLRSGRLGRGPYVVPILDDGVGVGTGVTWDLVRHGYDMRSTREDPFAGSAHRPPGSRIDALVVVDEFDAPRLPAGTPVVAGYHYRGAKARELGARQRRMCVLLTAHPPVVTPVGRSSIAWLPLAWRRLLERIGAGSEPPCVLARERDFPGLLSFGIISMPPGLNVADAWTAQALRDFVAKSNYEVFLLRRVRADVTRVDFAPGRAVG